MEGDRREELIENSEFGFWIWESGMRKAEKFLKAQQDYRGSADAKSGQIKMEIKEAGIGRGPMTK